MNALRSVVPGVATAGLMLLAGACSDTTPDASEILAEVESVVWAFHAADTARNADGVIQLLWPDFTMLADGNRVGYEDAAAGSRAFMASLRHFGTTWTDLQVLPLERNLALATFLFRDSIVTTAGALTQARGATTFVLRRRDGEWRVLFADADHYPTMSGDTP